MLHHGSDIDLKDPEVAKAVVLLQASFRGLKVRQKFKQQKVRSFKKLIWHHFICLLSMLWVTPCVFFLLFHVSTVLVV